MVFLPHVASFCKLLSADGQLSEQTVSRNTVVYNQSDVYRPSSSFKNGFQASRFSGSSHCQETPAGLTLDRSSVDCFHVVSKFDSSRGFRTFQKMHLYVVAKAGRYAHLFHHGWLPRGRQRGWPDREHAVPVSKDDVSEVSIPHLRTQGNRVLQQLLTKLQTCSDYRESLRLSRDASLWKTSGTFWMCPFSFDPSNCLPK
jgi:hypothetical protein